jgi:hypothetical protein
MSRRTPKDTSKKHLRSLRKSKRFKLRFVERRNVLEPPQLKVDCHYYTLGTSKVFIFLENDENTATAILLEPPQTMRSRVFSITLNPASPSPSKPPSLTNYVRSRLQPQEHLRSCFQRAFWNPCESMQHPNQINIHPQESAERTNLDDSPGPHANPCNHPIASPELHCH